MNLSDTPNWPEHPAVVLDQETFIGSYDRWDVWLYQYDGTSGLNINHGPHQDDWFTMADYMDGADEGLHSSMPAELVTFLKSLDSLHS